jgi:hypothetical protein
MRIFAQSLDGTVVVQIDQLPVEWALRIDFVIYPCPHGLSLVIDSSHERHLTVSLCETLF